MLEEPFFFLLSTDFPDLTEAKTSARTPPMRSKKSVKSVKNQWLNKKIVVTSTRIKVYFKGTTDDPDHPDSIRTPSLVSPQDA